MNNKFIGSKRGTAHNSMLQLLYANLNQPVDGDKLFGASGNQVNYQRRIRELREDGWNIDYVPGGEDQKGWYTLRPPFPSGEKFSRVSTGVRMSVLRRDKWTCQLCGRNRETTPNIILHVDHKIPFEISKNNSEKNLQTLCQECNLGKKAQCRDCVQKQCNNCELAFPKR